MIVIQNHKLILTALLILTVVSIFFIPDLKFKHNLSVFVQDNNDENDFYNRYLESFGPVDQMINIAVLSDKGIFQKSFLSKCDSFQLACEGLAEIKTVISIINFSDWIQTQLGLLEIPFLHVSDSGRYKEDSIRIFSDPRLTGWLVSDSTPAIIMNLVPSKILDDKERESLFNSIYKLKSQFNFDQCYVVSNVFLEEAYKRQIRTELGIIILISMLIMMILIWVIFRSYRILLFMLLTSMISLVLVLGMISGLKFNLTIITTILPSVIMVVGITDMVYFVNLFLNNLEKDNLIQNAIHSTYEEITFPTFLTSLTTAIGFLIFLTSPIKPFREFGIIMSSAVIIIYLVVMTLLPILLYLFYSKSKLTDNKGTIIFNQILEKLPVEVLRNKRGYSLIIFLIIILVGFGIFKTNTNRFISSRMVNDFQLSESYSFFEKHLYGTRNLEFAIITKKNESILDSINLFQIEKFTKYLENQPQTGFVYSPSTLVKNWNRAKNGLSWDHYIIPDANSLEKIKTLVNKHNKNVMMRCIDSTNHMGRVFCTLGDMGSEELFHYIEKAVSWISKNNDNPNLSFRVTGIVYLSEKSENKLISNMILNLFIAIVIISLMMGLLYRSYKIMFIAIIPNIFSLVLLAGIIGYFNIELSATISVIFTVSYVIIVDDTIHFLTRYRFERLNHNTEQAIKKTFIKVGKPIVITSIIMMAGFIAPIFSEFQDIYYTGILTMITLAIALLANLIILPLLIDW